MLCRLENDENELWRSFLFSFVSARTAIVRNTKFVLNAASLLWYNQITRCRAEEPSHHRRKKMSCQIFQILVGRDFKLHPNNRQLKNNICLLLVLKSSIHQISVVEKVKNCEFTSGVCNFSVFLSVFPSLIMPSLSNRARKSDNVEWQQKKKVVLSIIQHRATLKTFCFLYRVGDIFTMSWCRRKTWRKLQQCLMFPSHIILLSHAKISRANCQLFNCAGWTSFQFELWYLTSSS